MAFETKPRPITQRFYNKILAQQFFDKNKALTQALKKSLPTNRELINKIVTHGLQEI